MNISDDPVCRVEVAGSMLASDRMIGEAFGQAAVFAVLIENVVDVETGGSGFVSELRKGEITQRTTPHSEVPAGVSLHPLALGRGCSFPADHF